MPASKWLLSSLLLLTSLVIQLVVLDGLHLPMGTPDLIVLVLVCIALVTGPLQGMVLGFSIGLMTDLCSSHPAGRLALVLCFVGYCAGLATDESERSPLVALTVVAFGSAAAVVGYGAAALFTGDARIADTSLPSLLVAKVLYDVVLTPFVYPMVRGLLRRLELARP